VNSEMDPSRRLMREQATLLSLMNSPAAHTLRRSAQDGPVLPQDCRQLQPFVAMGIPTVPFKSALKIEKVFKALGYF